MFKGWEHAVQCKVCQGLQFVDANAPAYNPNEDENADAKTKADKETAAKIIQAKLMDIKSKSKNAYEIALNLALALEESGKSNCCGAALEYVGLRPKNEHILNTPELEEPKQAVTYEHNVQDVGGKFTIETIKAIPAEGSKEEETIEEIAVMVNSVKLNDIIDVNRKMSGRYMTDVVRAIMEEDNDVTQAKLDLLKEEYPSFFSDALKYVPKFLKTKYSLA